MWETVVCDSDEREPVMGDRYSGLFTKLADGGGHYVLAAVNFASGGSPGAGEVGGTGAFGEQDPSVGSLKEYEDVNGKTVGFDAKYV